VRRREFITLLTSTAVACPLGARAQQTGRRPVVGLVLGGVPGAQLTGPDPVFLPALAFVHRLRDLGWTDHTIVIERRSAESQPKRAPVIFAELIARGVDVMIVAASDWLMDAAQQATQSIPTVGIFTLDPAAAGLVASLARPGGNLTGVTTTTGRELDEKRLQLLKELAPGVARVGFLGTRSAWEAYLRGAEPTVVPPVVAHANRAEDLDEAFAVVGRERSDALLVSHGPVMFFAAPRIATFAGAQRLPAVYPWREAVEAGGLMSYGVSVQGLFQQAAGMVDQILKGAEPAGLPVQQPTKFELVINLKTAKALGLNIPQSILLRADEVIE
jgi:putative ABC transport system substrate-binding protein